MARMRWSIEGCNGIDLEEHAVERQPWDRNEVLRRQVVAEGRLERRFLGH